MGLVSLYGRAAAAARVPQRGWGWLGGLCEKAAVMYTLNADKSAIATCDIP
jgi:hypothetical protein